MSIFSDLNVLRFVTTSAGADDAGKIPQLNAAGELDASFISGTGNSIIVMDEGVWVGGGTFGTLDFVGAGVTATDAGAGVATITIPGGGSTNLQGAYVGGNTITTSSAEGAVIIAGSEPLQVTSTGGLDVNTSFDFDGTVFDVQVTGAGNDIVMNSAAGSISITADEAVGGALLLDATAGGLQFDAATAVDINSATFDLDCTSTIAITSSGAALDFDASTTIGLNCASTITIASSGAGVDIDAGTDVTIDADGIFSIDATPTTLTGTSNLSSLGNATTNTGITILSDNANAGALANSTLTINAINSGTNATARISIGSNSGAGSRTDAIGFFGAVGVGPASGGTTVTGSRGGNAALTSLLTVLTNYGLIVNSTVA